MIDLNLLREDPAAMVELCRKRGCTVDLQRLGQVDADLRRQLGRYEELRHEQKHLTPEVARERGRQIKEEVNALTQEIRALEEVRQDLWSRLPNLLAQDTPPGETAEGNLELKRTGTCPRFGFTPKPHEEVAAGLGILDLKRGTKVTESGFYYWRAGGAALVWALLSYAMDLLREHSFEVILTPILAKRHTLFGTGYLPFGEDQIYQLKEADLCLIGTTEQILVGLHGDEVLETDLPLLYASASPCFRTEAGAYGRQSRGVFRVHQFYKVEQVVFCRPEESEHYLQVCQENIEALMERLELHHRVVRVCLGDLGAPAYKKLDTEAWFPGFGDFRETHSNSNLLDFQTRRLNIRFRDGNRKRLPHTISATMATERIALAILEQFQQEDGSVMIPTVLRPYLGGRERLWGP